MTWRLFVDTGGTFTDCVAIAPDGGVRRAKVLSTSRLRGHFVDTVDRRRPRVALGAAVGDDVPRGFALARPGEAGGNRVDAFDPATGLLPLREPLDAGFRDGDAFELVASFESPVLAARLVTRTPGDRRLPPIAMRLATTRGTNALLERRAARTALIVTRGFADVLAIGDQRRPDLFALHIVKPPPLASLVIEVSERIDARGAIVEPLTDDEIARVVAEVRRGGAESVSVSLVHAWTNPVHERRLVEAIQTIEPRAVAHVVGASALGPTIGFLNRTVTAVVDGCVGPTFARHLADVAAELGASNHGEPRAPGGCDTPDGANAAVPSSPLLVMTSDAGLADAATFVAKDGLLSGPAGGVLGAVAAARRSGFERVIGFDMGGTSTDVARIDGEPPRRLGHRVGDAEIAAPAVAIETVAAGGGSVCDARHGELVVGPQSAGARPGPACYGLGGPLTLTDVNLLLGRVDGTRFEFALDRDASEQAAARVASRAAEAGRVFGSRETLLEAFIALADERMAEAIAAVSVRQGVDARDYALLAFGGAGGLHACGVAERLGIDVVLLPPDAGLLSAVGLASATLRRVAIRPVLATLALPSAACESGCGATAGEGECRDRAATAVSGADAVRAAIATATDEAIASLGRDTQRSGTEGSDSDTHRRITLRARLLGQESCIDLDFDGASPDAPIIIERFITAYRALYGCDPAPRPVEIESVRVAVERVDMAVNDLIAAVAGRAVEAARTEAVRAWSDGAWLMARCRDVESFAPGALLEGPALLRQPHGSAWLPADWTASMDGQGAIVMRRRVAAASTPDAAKRVGASLAGAARDELVGARLAAIASEMGELLRRTAVSTNVKERLDFSCGVLDAAGQLVVNAPHVPVHLGALGVCVRACEAALPLEPGDVALTNHPGFGGSHLPDLTVITPVFVGASRIGFVAARAHHAELGGVRPGSMPPEATSLADEAVVIPPMHLVRRGAPRWHEIESLLRGAPHPSRAVEDNLADLRAAVAACHHGASGLVALAAALGEEELARCTARLADVAESMTRRALARIPRGRREATERLDDGAVLAATVDVGERTARIDFTGSAGVHPANFNSTEAIVRSAVMYVLRLMAADAGVPAGGGLNEGLLRAVSIHVPFGILSPRFVADPARCPAVGAGNTETSQRLVDLLLKAFDVAAASQGTMNNLLFGRDAVDGRAGFGYYETIGGGSGASPGFDGADAVHVHMTNTRITDVEILEHRYPVRLERFAVRRGSGGRATGPEAGDRAKERCRRGGDGIVRELTFLEPMRVSLVTQRRASAPFGVPLDTGRDGAPGVNTLVRADGASTDLGSSASIDVEAGDRLRLETPGGGAWCDRA